MVGSEWPNWMRVLEAAWVNVASTHKPDRVALARPHRRFLGLSVSRQGCHCAYPWAELRRQKDSSHKAVKDIG